MINYKYTSRTIIKTKKKENKLKLILPYQYVNARDLIPSQQTLQHHLQICNLDPCLGQCVLLPLQEACGCDYQESPKALTSLHIL